MSDETQTFDQDLYDAVLSKFPAYDHADPPDAYDVWEGAAEAAATLAARQPDAAPVVGDEELLHIYRKAERASLNADNPKRGIYTLNDALAGIRAVREALAAQAVQVPEIPEGWHLQILDWHSTDEEYQVEMYYYGDEDEDILLAEGCHATDPFEAIRDAIRDTERHTAAIEQAKGGQGE